MQRCQNVFLSPLVGLDIILFLVELARTGETSEDPKRPFLPSTKDQPSNSRVMRDRYR